MVPDRHGRDLACASERYKNADSQANPGSSPKGQWLACPPEPKASLRTGIHCVQSQIWLRFAACGRDWSKQFRSRTPQRKSREGGAEAELLLRTTNPDPAT